MLIGISRDQLRDLIRETLQDIGLEHASADNAVELLMLTAATESAVGHYLTQTNGPAKGIFQMEPDTHRDILTNFLYKRHELRKRVHALFAKPTDSRELAWNLKGAIALARCHYLRFPEPLPSAMDILGMAKYYKTYWNTHLGSNTIERAARDYVELCRKEIEEI